MSGFAFGIDLGTTNSAAAFLAPGARVPSLALGPEGDRLTPSLVYVTRGGDFVVGAAARRLASEDPASLVDSWKREIADPHWSRTVRGRTLTPVLLSSLVLRRLLADLARATGEQVRECVVAVPAYYGELERGSTADAAHVAGLERVHTLNEPTAAALSYGLDARPGERARRCLVYDLGGGTFDVTVVELAPPRSPGKGATVRVLATAGEPRLGGKDWDDELLNLVAEDAVDARGLDPREDDRTLAELRRRVERAKHELSRSAEVQVPVPLPLERETFACKVTRERFESRTRGLLEQTATHVALALEKAGLRWDDVDAVLPTGGATRMPAVRELIRRVSGRPPLDALDPDEAVARGAAVYASFLGRASAPRIEAGPAREGQIEGLLPPAPANGTAASRETSPDEETDAGEEEDASATDGDALPLLAGERRVPEVEDVLSHALGVLCVKKGGGFKNVVLVPEQSRVPVSVTKTFKTVRPDQAAVWVKVLEGQDPDPEGCNVLGTLVVDGLPRGRARGQRVEVVYSLGEDGRLTVSARDVATDRRARATFERKGALGAREIERLRREVARQAVP